MTTTVLPHIGNNLYIMRSNQGHTEADIPHIQNAVVFDIDSGRIYQYSGNAVNVASFGSRTDQLFSSIIYEIPKNNIGTSYTDIFPAFYDGFPIPIDCNGFKSLGIVMLWNKNGGTGIHDMRLVNNADEGEVLVHTENVRVGNHPWTHDGLKSGRTKAYNIPIPSEFLDFRGELRIQAKSTVGTDDPIFNGLLIYLIR